MNVKLWYLWLFVVEPVESIERMKLWLQTKNRPESQLLDYWRKTAKDRLQFIHGDTTQPLSMICQQWPRYKDKDGHVLVGVYKVQQGHASNCVVSDFCDKNKVDHMPV